MNQTTRQAGVMSSQMRALGTTLKYLVSGSIVYGTMNMVRNLAQFQQQLGLISAIGTTAGFQLTGKNLEAMNQSLFRISSATITPLNETADAVTNLLSSVQKGQGLPRNQIPDAVIQIGRAAKLSQTPVEDMTKSVLAMNQAFGRKQTLENIKQIAGQWYELISTVPGGKAAAPQLVGQLGNLAGSARFAHITPGQMFALTAASLRFGMPPGQTGQGLAYLMRSIAQPESASTVKSARDIFASLRINNKFIQRQGGLAALFKIFDAAKAKGLRGDWTKVLGRIKATGDDPNLDPNSVADLGISGEGQNLLGGIFRRQHALRTAIAIYAILQQGTFMKDLDTLGDSTGSFQKQQKALAEGWKNFASQAPLSKAANDLQNMQMQISQAFAPVLNPIAGGASFVAGAARHHPEATANIARGAGALLMALGGAKVIGGLFGKKFPFIDKLLNRGGQAALTAKSLEDAAAAGGLGGIGAAVRGSTPLKPLYVTVVGQLLSDPGSGGSGRPPGSGTPGPQIPPWIKTTVEKGGRLGRLGTVLKAGIGAAGVAIIGNQIFDEIASQQAGFWTQYQVARTLGVMSRTFKIAPNRYLLGDPFGHYFLHGKGVRGFMKLNEQQFLTQALSGQKLNAGDEKFLAGILHTNRKTIQNLERTGAGADVAKLIKDGNDRLIATITGSPGDFTLNLTVTQDGKVVSKSKVHVNPADWSGGKNATSRGGRKTLRRTVKTTTGHQ